MQTRKFNMEKLAIRRKGLWQDLAKLQIGEGLLVTNSTGIYLAAKRAGIKVTVKTIRLEKWAIRTA